MRWRIGLLTAVMLLGAGVSPAAAWDGPLFDFRGEFPVPSGTLCLEARCTALADALTCLVESLGPSGRGFHAEGRFRLSPPDSPKLEQTAPTQKAPRWF